MSCSHISPPILATQSLGLIFLASFACLVFYFYVWHREKRLVGKNPLKCMRFIEAKFQLNKYATFLNQGSASAQLQSKFSTIDFLSTFLGKFLPAALHFLHFAKNGKKKERWKTISSTSMQIVLQSTSKGVRGLMHLKPDTWQALKDDGVAVEHHVVVLSKGKNFTHLLLNCYQWRLFSL